MLDIVEKLRLSKPSNENFPDRDVFLPFGLFISDLEKSKLLQIVQDNCNCERDNNKLIGVCSAHRMLTNRNILSSLIFNERTQAGLVRLEFAETPVS